MQNPRHGSKWYCGKCHTWCAAEAPKCSWCGSGRPAPKPAQKPAPKKDEEE